MIHFDWNWVLLYLTAAMAVSMIPSLFFLKRIRLIAMYLITGYVLVYGCAHAYRPSISGELARFSIADPDGTELQYQAAVRPFPVFPDEKFEISVHRPKKRTGRWLECDLFRADETKPLDSLFGLPTWRVQAEQGEAFYVRLACGLQTRAGTNWRERPAVHQNVSFPYVAAWYRTWTYAFPVIIILSSLFVVCRRLQWVRLLERESNEKSAQGEGDRESPSV